MTGTDLGVEHGCAVVHVESADGDLQRIEHEQQRRELATRLLVPPATYRHVQKHAPQNHVTRGTRDTENTCTGNTGT